MKTPVKILYIEDDELDQRAFLRVVRDKALPYEVTSVQTLAEARSHLAETRFDLIIADYHLPDGVSVDLFDEVRDIPFVLLTGTLEENLALRTLARGADDYLMKDVDRRYLEAIPFTVEKTLYREHVHEMAQQLARQLRESEADLNRAQAVAQTGSWRLDMRRKELLWSDETYRIFGIPRGTPMTYETFLAAVHPQDRDDVDRQWTEALRGEPYDIEHRIVVGGELKWVREKAELEFDQDGTPLGGFGTVQDITDRKRAEEAVRQSEAILDTFFRNTPAGLVIYTDDNRYVRASKYAADLYGLPVDAIVGKSIAEVLSPDLVQVTEKRNREVLETNQPITTGVVSARLPLRSPEAETTYWQGVRFPVPLPGGKTGVGVVNVDVTERVRAEEALRELTATLESKVTQRTAELRHRTRQLQKLALETSAAEDRERERLAHILHDDLQQVLAAAKFHLSIVTSRIKDDSSVREITAKVDEMLKDAIGKSRSLSHELSPAVLHQDDLAEILRWLANEMQAKHGLTVHVQGRAHCQSDPIKAFLYRTAQELLFNAVKHAQVSEARVRIRAVRRICLSIGLGSRLRLRPGDTPGSGRVRAAEHPRADRNARGSHEDQEFPRSGQHVLRRGAQWRDRRVIAGPSEGSRTSGRGGETICECCWPTTTRSCGRGWSRCSVRKKRLRLSARRPTAARRWIWPISFIRMW